MTEDGTVAVHTARHRHDGNAHSDRDDDEISPKEEMSHVLEELRILLPGSQVLLAFLLSVPFQNRFAELTLRQERAFFLAFVASAAAVVFLIAPSAIHRLQRQPRRIERLLRAITWLAIAGSALLVVAIGAVVYLITDILHGSLLAAAVSGSLTLLALALWYILPLVKRF